MAHSSLHFEIDQVIGLGMGASLSPGRPLGFLTTSLGATISAFVAVIFVFSLPIWLLASRDFTPVVQLSIWGALYFAWAVLIAHIATAAVKSHLDEVIPLPNKKFLLRKS